MVDVFSQSQNASPAKHSFCVAEEEAGEKLLQCLERRLGLARSLLHRWIRTGQVRKNGARTKPFERLAAGDMIRLPPFAASMRGNSQKTEKALPLPPLVGEGDGFIVLAKPAGLAVHGGTGQKDSLALRLRSQYEGAPFIPVPCHRLDRETSGLLLVATRFAVLREMQYALQHGLLQKDYLCWVAGTWPWKEQRRLCDYVRRASVGDSERMEVCSADRAGAKEARCLVLPLMRERKKSLLLVRLETGRTHQIRLQMAERGHAVLGDRRYGTEGGALLLHAFRLRLPSGELFSLLPSWKNPFALSTLPFDFPPLP